MCGILDANVIGEVFGSNLSPAGKGFFDWIDKKSGVLVIGGKLREELGRSTGIFRDWAQQAQQSGRLRAVDDSAVNTKEEELRAEGLCQSNDHHIVALALVSGARLLYSNDTTLHIDFKNRALIPKPNGVIYSTNRDAEFNQGRQNLLRRKNLCRVGQ